MASIVETKSVSLRKGDSAANKTFVGVLGELVADLGTDGLGTDLNTTLRLHNGVVEGGIPMCRADLSNISTSQLASGRENLGLATEKNLAYADLSNIETSTDSTVISTVVDTLSGYGLAKTDYIDTQLNARAKIDMSNVTTADLATSGHGHSGKNLAYADTSNVNTSDLVSDVIHTGANGDKPLCYYDFTNANTTALTTGTVGSGPLLAAKDLTNVTASAINALLFSTHASTLHIEQTTNKISNIESRTTNTQYPTAEAVATYVESKIGSGQFMNNDISNATSFDTLYSNYLKTAQESDISSNNSFAYKYLVGSAGITTAGSGFTAGRIYTDNTVIDTGTTQTDRLQILVTAVNSSGIPTSVAVYQTKGVENIAASSPVTIKDSNGNTVQVTLSATSSGVAGIYNYTATSFNTTASTGTFTTGIYDTVVKVPLKQLLWVKVDSIGTSGRIASCSFLPKFSNTYFSSTTKSSVTVNSGTANATVSFNCYKFVPTIGGAGVAKTDLSNLLGMTDDEAKSEEGRAWRLIKGESLPSLTENALIDSKYCTIATQGKIWDALKGDIANYMGIPAWKASTSYVTSPKPSVVYYNGSIYYCISAHTSTSTFNTSKWTLINSAVTESLSNKKTDLASNKTSDVYYPTCKATATYVANQIATISLPDHYKGQVDDYFQTQASLPSSPATGYSAFLRHYNNSTYPYIATYNGTAWTYTAFASAGSTENGNFVYCLDLGADYNNVSGNITWNANNSDVDIAPNSYLQPDNVTITTNGSGQLQLDTTLKGYVDTVPSLTTRVGNIESALTGASVPSPQFFTGTNTAGQQLTLNENVAFDLYVNGVFQYPNTYTFNSTTKVVTLSFAVQDTSANGIAVIYKGLKFNT